MKLTVQSTLGAFKEGQVLKREAEIIKYHRTVLDEGANKPSALTDEQIMACVEAVEGDGEDQEIERIEMMEAGGIKAEGEGEQPEPEVSPAQAAIISATGNAVALAAVNAAAKLGVKSHFNDDIAELHAAKEKLKAGPLVIAMDLELDFTPEEIEAMPIPGSTPKDVLANMLPDRYTATITVDGKQVKQPASYYGKLFDTSAAGAAIMTRIASIDAAKAGKVDAPAHYKAMSKPDLTAERNNETQKRDTGRTKVIEAVKFLKMKHEIERLLPDVAIDMIWKDKEKRILKNTPTPIKVMDKADRSDVSVCSVGTFLTYKPETAKAKGGKVANLRETAGKGANGEQKKETEQPSYDRDVFIRNAMLMADYMNKVRADEKALGNLYAFLNTKAGDALLCDLFRIEEFVEVIVSKKELQHRHAAIQAELAEDGAKAIADKTVKQAA